MPSLSLTQPHSLGKEEALARLKNFLARVKERHQDKLGNLEETWTDNQLQCSFSAMGFKVKGDVVVEDDQVRVSGQIPLAAMMFKGKIEQTMRDELTRLLA